MAEEIKYRNLGAFSSAGGFNVANSDPMDSRQLVADITHIFMDGNWADVKPYPGLIVSDPNGEVRIYVGSKWNADKPHTDWRKEESWKKIGSNGSMQIPIFTINEGKIAEATADNIGQVIYVTTGTTDYPKGPYIVTGAGIVSKLGVTTATGDLAGDVEVLKSTVGNAASGLVKDVADLQSGKVDKVAGSRLITIGEVNKLSGISAGAQVNVIEKIIFNGEEVVVDNQKKSVTLNTPQDKVRGLADGEKVLSLDDNTGKLGTTLSLEYFKDEADHKKPKIRIKGINGAQVGEAIDASEFVKDGMLTNVELVENPEGKTGTFLVFTWNTDAKNEPIVTDVNVTDLVDVYTKGDGIDITGKVVKAKAKDDDPYIEVTTEGIASKGIDDAITSAKNDIVGDANKTTENDLTIRGVKAYVDANFKVKDVDTTANSGISLSKSDLGKVSVSVDNNALVAALVGTTGVVGSVSGTTIKLGKDIVIDEVVKDAEGNESIQHVTIGQAGSSIQSTIETLAGKIETAIAGGITAIDGGEYITVGGSATSKTLVVNTAKIGKYLVDNSSAIKADINSGKLTLEWEDVQ